MPKYDIVMVCLSGKLINLDTYIKKYVYSLKSQKLIEPRMVYKNEGGNYWEDVYYLIPGKYLIIETNVDNARHSCVCKRLKVFSKSDYLSDKIERIPNVDIRVFKELYRFGGWEIGEWEGIVPNWVELPCGCLYSGNIIYNNDIPEIEESEEDRQERINYKQPKEVEDKLGTLLLKDDIKTKFLIDKSKKATKDKNEDKKINGGQKMSVTSEIYTITSALERAEKIMNLKKEWVPKNDIQKRFLSFLQDCRESIIPEIDVEVGSDAGKINNFLEKKGFSIKLQPFPPNTLGFASVLDLLVEWLYLGEKVKIKTKNDEIYDGVRIKKEGISFFEYNAKGYSCTIARLSTKSGDNVFITVPKEPVEGLDLIEMANNLSNNKEILLNVYDGIRFPMVDLDITNDIEWLKGISNTNGVVPVEITQAVQQVKIKMNEKGARFKSATAVAITLMAVMAPRPDLIINEPFLLWLERHGMKKPLMAAFITEESWKNPGELGK